MKRFAIALVSLILLCGASIAQDLLFRPVLDLPKDFIMGADVSMLDQLESSGATYYDLKGKKADPLAILKSSGINWIRLRLWVDPVNEADVVEGGKTLSKAGEPVGGGNNGLESYLRVAKRAKKLGLKVMADFHYSDFWADPGKQYAPKAWKGLALPELKKALYAYTDSSLKAMKAAKAMPDLVQVGNEVDNGFIWPVGKLYPSGSEAVGGREAFDALLKEAIRAVRDNDPKAADPAKRIPVMIHLSSGGDNAHFRKNIDPLVNAGVDFDVIGLSFYPYWHGKLGDLTGNMADLATRYGKRMIVAEAAYAWTAEDADGFPNAFNSGSAKLGGYRATPQGQASAIGDIIAAAAGAPAGKGIGVLYWEPDWIPAKGVGWRTGEGNNWENQALFDFDGRALPSIEAFKRARAKAELPDLKIVSIEGASLEIPAGGVLKLPETLNALYTDDSYRPAQVNWEKPEAAALKAVGSLEVQGKVWGYDKPVVAAVSVVADVNLVPDSSFESGKLAADWILEGPGAEAALVEKNPGNAHSGDWSFKYWLGKPFRFTLLRRLTGLEDGTYSLRAWAAGGGGEKAYALFARAYGGSELTAAIVNTGWQKWRLYEIKGIPVTGGACEIGLYMDGDSGNWGNMDDIVFVREAK